MNLDRDLRDALKPLRGDAVADAERVLGALPSPDGGGLGSPKGLPGLASGTWWLLAGVLAVGGLLGYVLGTATSPAAPAEEAQPRDEENQPKEDPEDPKDEPQDKPKDRPKEPPQGARQMEGYLLLRAFGEVTVNEPKQPKEVLKPDQYYVSTGTIFETEKSMAGVYVYGNDARVRLGEYSAASVDGDRIVLRAGRLWLSTMTRPSPFRIETDLGTLLTDAADVVVERDEARAIITVLDGAATVRTVGGDSRRIEAMQRVEVDARGSIGDVADVAFAGTATSWMTKMILLQTDTKELDRRIADMVDAYVEGTNRDAAARELHRLGAAAVPQLFNVLDGFAPDTALVHKTAQLIGDIANDTYHEWLMAMLERGDEETRAIAFRALVRVTGTQEEDESFWRAGTSRNREVAARVWRQKLR